MQVEDFEQQYCKWGYQDNFKPVHFSFLRRNFERKKSTKTQNKRFPPSQKLLRSFCARKKLLPLLFFVHLILFCQFVFACDVFLCAQNFFVKKKINWLKIVLSSIIYEGIEEVSILLFFYYEEILHARKSIKCKQATFTHIFYAHKKHKKHKKQLLLMKSAKCNKFCRYF